MPTVEFENDGPQLRRTNWYDLFPEQCALSWASGLPRLLIPASLQRFLGVIRPADDLSLTLFRGSNWVISRAVLRWPADEAEPALAGMEIPGAAIFGHPPPPDCGSGRLLVYRPFYLTTKPGYKLKRAAQIPCAWQVLSYVPPETVTGAGRRPGRDPDRRPGIPDPG